MGLFRPYERTEKSERSRTSTVLKPQAAETPIATEPPETEKIVVRRGEKKSTPTPTRREAETARMERLHPSRSRKDQKKADREARYKAQADAWDRVEKSPERTLLRDFVDTRWTVAEFMMPAMILIMAAMIVVMADPQLSFYVAMSLWGLFLLMIINIWAMWRSYKQLLSERVPNAKRKGLLMYMVNRAMMLRRFRRPRPRIKRGDPI